MSRKSVSNVGDPQGIWVDVAGVGQVLPKDLRVDSIEQFMLELQG